MRENMNYQIFLNEIVEIVKEKVEQDCNVRLNQVLKNNGLTRDAIVILKEGEMVSPNIYLEYYYDRYCDGESLDEVGDEIVAFYEETVSKKQISPEDYLDFSKYRDFIFYRIVHFEKNEKLLQEIPHIRYLDLAITFHCLVGESKQGIQSYCITEPIIERWGLTKEELYHIARKNTPLLFPPRISTMEEVVTELTDSRTGESQMDFHGDLKLNSKLEYEQYVQRMIEKLPFQTDIQMYVISNLSGVNGAAALLYPRLIKWFAEKCKKNLYLLPSSIHEMIAVPESECRREELEQMVCEVNSTQVARDEILSDTVYFYDWKKGELCM